MLSGDILKGGKMIFRCREKNNKGDPLKELRHHGLIFFHMKQNMKSAGENVGGARARLKHEV